MFSLDSLKCPFVVDSFSISFVTAALLPVLQITLQRCVLWIREITKHNLCDKIDFIVNLTGGPCRLNCQPKYCDQSCPQGGCTITCPSDNKVCQQMCGPGKQCTKDIMPPPTTPATTTVTTAPPFVPDECESLEDGVCYQFCPGGSCVLECFNSTYYIIHVLNLAVVEIAA